MMLEEKISGYQLTLGSKSPRRDYLLRELGLKFNTRVIETDESYPKGLNIPEIAPFLAKTKGNAHLLKIKESEIVITADTIVAVANCVLNKPTSKEQAVSMLQQLSGTCHTVYTGVCLTNSEKQLVFCESTEVWFHALTNEEINFYIESCKPFDKAGSYGIQEWMGYAGIKKINGDFFSVMGLPLQLLYRKLNEFISE